MADELPKMPIYEVPYTRLFPGLRLFRAPGAACDAKVLILAVLGLIFTTTGRQLIDGYYPGPPPRALEWGPAHTELGRLATRLMEPVFVIVAPFAQVCDLENSGGQMVRALLEAGWCLVVWTLIGGAIARIAAVRLTCADRLGIGAALKFVGQKAVPLVTTPLIPMFGIVILSACVAAFGLIYWLPKPAGPMIAGVLAFLPLLAGLLLTLIVLGLAIGWPLMQASVAVEAEDGFDAVSRSYAYVYQRPWHYAGYVILASILGIIGLAFVELFGRLVLYFAAFGLTLSNKAEIIASYYDVSPTVETSMVSMTHGIWVMLVQGLVHGWVYAYFWTAMTVIYLLLRRDVDGIPVDEINYNAPRNLLVEAAAAYRVAPPTSAGVESATPHRTPSTEAAEATIGG